MFTPVRFQAEMEELVRFIEETDPAAMVESTFDRLKRGTPPRALLTASSLAIVRSTELPPQHHGGPVHPICGVHAVGEISRRLPGDLSYLPLIQHAVLCNNHVHSPLMGPYLMPEMEPVQGSATAVGTYHMSDEAFHGEVVAPSGDPAQGPLEVTKEAFQRTVLAKQGPAAEHHFLWLLERLSPGEALDQLLPLALGRNHLDDHNFLYPVYTARALDQIGWQWAPVLFRPAVRYQAREQAGLRVRSALTFEDVEALIDDHGLLGRELAQHSSAAESERIFELGRQLGAARNYHENVELTAVALADGLSLEGAGEALSIGAALAYLSTSYGNPMDSHLHTGAANRRYLLKMDGVSIRHKILGLLTGFTGPEVILAEGLLNWQENLDPDVTESLPVLNQTALLDALTESIEGQPWIDWRTIGVAFVVAPDEVKRPVALARQYAQLGYSAEAYFERLAEISCRDDFTEMHALKHFQAIVDEYYSTREPYRWVHMASAAKSAAIVHVGREQRIYLRSRELLAA
jgi:hypothetical protein